MTAKEWLHQLLDIMVQKEASDLLISVNAPPTLKMAGQLIPLGDQGLSVAQVTELVGVSLPEAQRERFRTEHEANFALSLKGMGRFRVSAFQQRNQMAMVVRRIGFDIPHLEELSLPATLGELANVKRGLVFVVGGTGTGKSTTLASMIQQRNETVGGHIISVEDPIEYVHPHRKAIINQREVGIDTESFEVALKNTLRQAPDVILIGEVRTRETMEHALTFAETGHLCLATLHANNANQALDRIINFFPIERHAQVWLDLSLNLHAIVAQQLLPTVDGGRCPAIEIMLKSPLIGDLVRKGEVGEIKKVMSRSRDLGMQTFDQALYELFKAGKITEEVALVHADSANDLRMMIKFADESGDGVVGAKEAASHLSLRGEDDF
ncbi:PilT/PilU family type 4a pilus ATPase [Halomonas saccharevitans]|uniref:Twitching motility protein PilU n=1 Tax=Halomonas saccharevitans TaxID=416872 RepID=A0A1I7CUI7_9GAMM|nr:PilT/PilU family type 4a pilus ATPase [Halomonas saccharevitans]SFU03080.1 twitching motility protein PilU [Halomonas saccharevitans]